MQLDYDKLAALGIEIKDTEKEVLVFHGDEIFPSTCHELSLAFDKPLKFVVSGSKSRSLITQTNKKELFPSFDQFSSEEEFSKTVRTAVSASDENDAPIVKLLNNLLSLAISRNASDLHLDVNQSSLEIRFRIDGVISTFASLERDVARMLTTRIKLLSELDITERRRPQDGSMSMNYYGRIVDIRVATLPVLDNERIVLRFFSGINKSSKLSDIGLKQRHLDAFSKVISKQAGLILVCGPTGSGKTTTIYALLSSLVGRGLSIMSIEDPVEINLDEVVQTQVNEKVSFGFAEGLRALLRNDPDVILVGEIRDSDTANIAVRAAMTGHLVISTVHANNPVSAIKRLKDLGVDNSILAECLLGVFTQRLLKHYCPECKRVSQGSAAHTSSTQIAFEGCNACHNSGFKGRAPVMSHLLVDNVVKTQIEHNPSVIKVENEMLEEAKDLYGQGKIPFSEVAKVS